ncbi:unnamed protein product [Ilex paraguariensis]|uniref:Glycine-rich protein n=1 Tax=Ilex paraguariensis TaxID=185542 RepID=A0ABC8UHY4_9AQUA
MESKEMIFLLLVLLYFICPASLFPLPKTLSSVNLQEDIEEKHSSINRGRKLIAHHSNFGHGVGARGGGGGGHVGGERGPGGEGASNGGNTQGGAAAVIPLYAAGAANGHRTNHHSAGSCNHSCIGFPTLCAALLASLLVVVHIYGVFGLKAECVD